MVAEAEKVSGSSQSDVSNEVLVSPNLYVANDLQQKLLHTQLGRFDHSGMLYSSIDLVRSA